MNRETRIRFSEELARQRVARAEARTTINLSLFLITNHQYMQGFI